MLLYISIPSTRWTRDEVFRTGKLVQRVLIFGVKVQARQASFTSTKHKDNQ